jgi:hypothetical protein
MDARYDDTALEQAEIDPNYNGGLDAKRVRALRKVMNLVRQLPNEVELRRYPSLHFE